VAAAQRLDRRLGHPRDRAGVGDVAGEGGGAAAARASLVHQLLQVGPITRADRDIRAGVHQRQRDGAADAAAGAGDGRPAAGER
jgi:hypothetical protein